MNRIIYKILAKRNAKRYENYIINHRYYIEDAFIEMVMNKDMAEWMDWEYYHVELYDRVKNHDFSKFDKEEFEPYRKHFYPVHEEEKILNEEDFNKAWEHHWKNNRHHWQARSFDVCENDKLSKEQILDCLENVLDWMAMGYAFNDRPYQFYEKNKNEIRLPKAQEEFIEKIIYEGIDKQYIKRGV